MELSVINYTNEPNVYTYEEIVVTFFAIYSLIFVIIYSVIFEKEIVNKKNTETENKKPDFEYMLYLEDEIQRYETRTILLCMNLNMIIELIPAGVLQKERLKEELIKMGNNLDITVNPVKKNRKRSPKPENKLRTNARRKAAPVRFHFSDDEFEDDKNIDPDFFP